MIPWPFTPDNWDVLDVSLALGCVVLFIAMIVFGITEACRSN